jgi:phosphoribosylformimino-5-aminoimidazole carboxamide ribotide isomerase
VGGGITADNALEYLNAGASHVIVTSWIFPEGKLDRERLERLSQTVGKERLVLDLSCKRVSDPEDANPRWKIATNRWQTIIDIEITKETLEDLAKSCDEFLVHAADVEGKQQGMDDNLIRFLAENSPIPVTYAGGAKSLDDLKHCKEISNGKIDLTIGSALDLFGGKGVKYDDCVRFNKAQG